MDLEACKSSNRQEGRLRQPAEGTEIDEEARPAWPKGKAATVHTGAQLLLGLSGRTGAQLLLGLGGRLN